MTDSRPPGSGAARVARPRVLDEVDAPAGALLDVHGLVKHFAARGGFPGRAGNVVRAVDGVRFWLRREETLGLVGESGSGKTTTGRTLLRLIEPTAGSALFDGRDIFRLGARELQAFRRRAQLIFQDPYGSLNPRLTAGSAIAEVLRTHGIARADESRRVMQLLNMVGLPDASASRYPHEFSGGQRQRIGIARALAVEPDMIVCDEPVSALDVSVQAQVLNLLGDLQRELGIALLFIAHDLSVVEHVSHRIAVMYLGRIVETGTTQDVIGTPVHPYTRALLSAVPVPRPRRQVSGNAHARVPGHAAASRVILEGDAPNPADPPSGCPFHPRCPHPRRDADCARIVPPLEEKRPGHFAACIKEAAVIAGPGVAAPAG